MAATSKTPTRHRRSERERERKRRGNFLSPRKRGERRERDRGSFTLERKWRAFSRSSGTQRSSTSCATSLSSIAASRSFAAGAGAEYRPAENGGRGFAIATGGGGGAAAAAAVRRVNRGRISWRRPGRRERRTRVPDCGWLHEEHTAHTCVRFRQKKKIRAGLVASSLLPKMGEMSSHGLSAQ